jgi:hypothetical protein
MKECYKRPIILKTTGVKYSSCFSNFDAMDAQEIIFQILWRYKQRQELTDTELHELRLWLMESEYNEILFDDLSNNDKWERELKRNDSVDDKASMNKIRDRLKASPRKKFLR